ncbi:DUF4175 family protein [Raineya orbicola]|uniref:ATPase n=1 Tax=Raineya orbicola TaxID=2016530 RepID=A0A2N3IJL6_9BACT|nr:DUF4175 family protein [Raineya orbicola]PKQ70471.1 hypothetical protein Rain11_0554 [Raineya orbicola]
MNLLNENLNRYKRKYYLNLLLRGTLIVTLFVLATYLLFSTAEYFGRFSSSVRGFLLFSFVATAIFSMAYWVILPLMKMLHILRQISDEQAAVHIGSYFQDINDKLLNALQLKKIPQKTELLLAAVEQKGKQLSIFNFADAIDLSENRKYLRYFLLLLLLAAIGFWIGGLKFFTEPSKRIIRYTETFADEAPFKFLLQNKTLKAFKGEDLKVWLKLQGNALPQEVYLVTEEGKIKMLAEPQGGYFFNFQKIQKAEKFYFEAAGFQSDTYQIELLERPSLLSFNANLLYPAYLGKTPETIKNIGNLVVPEGTQIEWTFNVSQTDSLFLSFEGDKNIIFAEKTSNKTFSYARLLKASQNYSVRLKNQHSENKEAIAYYINVIPDQYPKIGMETYRDTSLYSYVSVGGSISDDYGITRLAFFYRIMGADGKPRSEYKAVPIGVQAGSLAQNFYYEMDLKPLNLRPGEQIEYFAQVWDNDGVNGAKSAKTLTYQFKVPDETELRNEVDKSARQTASKIDKTLQKARDLKRNLQDLDSKIKTKPSLDYNDRKQIQDILQKKQELEKDIKELQELNNLNEEKKNLFDEQKNEELKEKLEQLQKLMDNLLDEETKKLYEELEKLLEQQRNDPKLQEQLEKILNKEENLEKELDRTLELFKQMQYEQKFEDIKNDLKNLSQEQQKLAEETEKANPKNQEGQKDLEQKQEKLNEKFDNLKKEMEKLEKMNQELQEPNPSLKMEEQMQEVDKEQDKSLEELQKQNSKDNKKASQSQRKAAQKMKEMNEKMEQMSAEMEMEGLEEDINNLRNILDNLVKLSYEQEDLMKQMRNLNVSDPRFNELAQKQIKLKDDAQVIEDSLQALAKRQPMIESFVTRELSDMRRAMESASKAIKERKLGLSSSKQQSAMTSMNNLALMLNSSMQEMQNQMSGKSGKGKNKKNQKGDQPSLGELQKQLGQKIQELKKSGKTGNQLSEELAKLAAQQEALRRMLEQMRQGQKMDKNGKNMGEQLGDLIKEMEKNEEDLINKRLTDRLIQRQKDIETRLLEYEKAMRERGEEEKRKGETATPKEKKIPKNLEPYTKPKEKQIEMLRTLPPALNPYFKREIDKYFEKIGK